MMVPLQIVIASSVSWAESGRMSFLLGVSPGWWIKITWPMGLPYEKEPPPRLFTGTPSWLIWSPPWLLGCSSMETVESGRNVFS